ncbi:MAG: energy transducer TonB [Verrucomicrobiae bacterium]|nr:energy transducer TonB [Verrucomicrobiae bacterium]MCP5521455.1 energy transducer TonB [Verrucomicrobiales bacterium]
MKLVWPLLLAVLLAPGSTGCRSKKPKPLDYYDSFQTSDGEASDRGSIADLNRRMGQGGQAADPSKPQAMHFLVVHDVDGKPVYVELQRSSGNPDLDRRARLMIMRDQRFPPGKANTLTVTVEPREVPKE